MIQIIWACIVAVTLVGSTSVNNGNVYYVNSNKGNDKLSGRSPDQAWASLQKVNEHIFQSGDNILFKAGTKYDRQLKPQGSGKEGAPITINQYGEGQKPRINGYGEYKAALWLYNVEYWEINNLEVTNTGKDREPGRRGVIIEAWNYGEAHHIYLDSLTIHDVSGSLVKSKGGGSAILWKNGGGLFVIMGII